MNEFGLVGNYTHSLDVKNRVFFPAKFREDLGVPFIITVTTDKCLMAYSMPEWTKFVENLRSLPKSKVKDIMRFFCGNAVKCTPDSQGRVNIPKELLQSADIKDTVTFVGCGDRVELWAEYENPLVTIDDDYRKEIDEQMRALEI